MNTVQDRKSIYWHRDLPPVTAEFVAEHAVEADSSRVEGTLAHRDELWGRCYGELMTRAETRLTQEIARLGGDYAHIHDESIVPKHDAASGESWLHGSFTYNLYRRRRGSALPTDQIEARRDTAPVPTESSFRHPLQRAPRSRT